MQNSILMKDTQLFLMEVCLCWLACFICPSNTSSDWAGCFWGGYYARNMLASGGWMGWEVDGEVQVARRGEIKTLGCFYEVGHAILLEQKPMWWCCPSTKITGRGCKSCGQASTPWCWLVLKQQAWQSYPETEVAISSCLVKLPDVALFTCFWQPWQEVQRGQTCVCAIQTHRWAMGIGQGQWRVSPLRSHVFHVTDFWH